MSSIQTTAKLPASKITRAQVEAELEKRNKAIENANAPPKPVSSTIFMINRNTFNSNPF